MSALSTVPSRISAETFSSDFIDVNCGLPGSSNRKNWRTLSARNWCCAPVLSSTVIPNLIQNRYSIEKAGRINHICTCVGDAVAAIEGFTQVSEISNQVQNDNSCADNIPFWNLNLTRKRPPLPGKEGT
mgnify:FL=1